MKMFTEMTSGTKNMVSAANVAALLLKICINRRLVNVDTW